MDLGAVRLTHRLDAVLHRGSAQLQAPATLVVVLPADPPTAATGIENRLR